MLIVAAAIVAVVVQAAVENMNAKMNLGRRLTEAEFNRWESDLRDAGMRYLVSRGVPEQDAKDIVQIVLTNFWKNFNPHYFGEASLPPKPTVLEYGYFYRLLGFGLYDYLKMGCREVKKRDLVAQELETEAACVVDLGHDFSLEAIKPLLAGLNVVDRMLLLFKFVTFDKELVEGELAEIMQLCLGGRFSPCRVRVRLWRLMMKLQRRVPFEVAKRILRPNTGTKVFCRAETPKWIPEYFNRCTNLEDRLTLLFSQQLFFYEQLREVEVADLLGGCLGKEISPEDVRARIKRLEKDVRMFLEHRDS